MLKTLCLRFLCFVVVREDYWGIRLRWICHIGVCPYMYTRKYTCANMSQSHHPKKVLIIQQRGLEHEVILKLMTVSDPADHGTGQYYMLLPLC